MCGCRSVCVLMNKHTYTCVYLSTICGCTYDYMHVHLCIMKCFRTPTLPSLRFTFAQPGLRLHISKRLCSASTSCKTFVSYLNTSELFKYGAEKSFSNMTKTCITLTGIPRTSWALRIVSTSTLQKQYIKSFRRENYRIH